jgi:hypothetical protein
MKQEVQGRPREALGEECAKFPLLPRAVELPETEGAEQGNRDQGRQRAEPERGNGAHAFIPLSRGGRQR